MRLLMIKNTVLFDFMIYAWKIETNVETFDELTGALWAIFSCLLKDSQSNNVVFNMYLESTIKYDEIVHRQKQLQQIL